MNLSNQLTPQTLLSIVFAIIGIVLIVVLIIARVIFFFLNTFTKKKTNSNKKSFFIPLVGVSFIVVLSLLANNPFIYAIAIIIIATLITELEFLEKLMALLWNRGDYWQFRQVLVTSKLPQQSSTETPEEKKELEGLGKKLGTTAEVTVNPPVQNNWFLQFHSERVYRLIFGSQIGILQWIEIQAEKGVSKAEIEAAYATNPISSIYPFESYIGFLINNGLIRYDPTTIAYFLLPVGKFFLLYIAGNGLPTNKPD